MTNLDDPILDVEYEGWHIVALLSESEPVVQMLEPSEILRNITILVPRKLWLEMDDQKRFVLQFAMRRLGVTFVDGGFDDLPGLV